MTSNICCSCKNNKGIYKDNNNNYYCEECYNNYYFVCDSCGNVISVDDLHETANGASICSSCVDLHYFVCDSCEEIYHDSDCYFYNNYTFCRDCYCDALSDCGIKHYKYIPNNIIFHHSNHEPQLRCNTPYIGIELEIQGLDRDDFCCALKEIYQTEEKFYLKQDGSLIITEGVEIVSMPMSYKFITQTEHWKTIFQLLDDYCMNNTNNCGLHFHIDRNYCSSLDSVSTIDYIVNNYTNYFEKIGGRDFNELHFFCKKVKKDLNKWGCPNFNRYTAVNLENDNTIELRFCKSTNIYDIFINRVKMVFGIIHFADKYKVNDIKDWSEDLFVNKFNEVCKEFLD